MTTYCQTLNPFWNVFPRGVAISDEADRVESRLRELRRHYLRTRLEELVPAIDDAVAQSRADALPVDQETADAAIEFAYMLPYFASIPEVSADPDGEISFDWFGPSGKMFSASINKSGRLSYAGWFGEDSRVHGTEKLCDAVLQEVMRYLLRTTQ